MISGTYTALVTPFRDDAIDREAYRRLIDSQFAGGVTGIVPVGTTGESPTVSYDEHFELIRLAVEFAGGRGKVMAGTGSNSTAEAIEATRKAEELGADSVLVVAPYYNKPNQEGVFRHFQAIASATSLPVMLYSIPGRCAIEIAVETVARLAEACPNIRSIKEAGGNVERVHQLRASLPDDFTILSGDDSLTLPFMASGAVGVVSVASNLIPAGVAALVNAMLAGDLAAARAAHYRYYPLFKGMLSLDVNPAPIKAALAMAGLLPGDELRLPLLPLDEAKRATLRGILTRAGVLQ
jgi:4-hydroxy-tetrahydrodipicolinate synthase